jgi:DNA modification methylase
MTHVPVIVLDHLSEAQVRAYVIAENRLAEKGSSWSKEILSLELNSLAGSFPSLDLTLTGFDSGEVELLQSITLGGDEVMAEVHPQAPEAEPVTKFGDLWQINRSRLVCGDAKDAGAYAALLRREKAHLTITDPPFNVAVNKHIRSAGKHREFVEASGELNDDQWESFVNAFLAQLTSWCRPGSVHYIFMDWRSIRLLLDMGERYYDELLNLVVWRKTNAGLGSFYRSQHELVAVFRYASRKHINNIMLGINGRNRSNVWDYPGVNSFGSDRSELLTLHPTCKPVSLLADAIKDASHPDHIVLDPFGGSGSLLLAAEQTDRQARLIELDPLYCDTIIRRAASAGLTAKLVSTGQSFEEVEDERRT